MSKRTSAPTPGATSFDGVFPYRLSEADDSALYRLRGLVTLLGDLSGSAIANRQKPSVDVESLHATCWLMQELIDDIIGRYTLDYTARRQS